MKIIKWSEETIKKLAKTIGEKLTSDLEEKMEDFLCENNISDISSYEDSIIADVLEEYFENFDVEDVQDELPDEMFDDNGCFKEKEFDVVDDVRELLYDEISKYLVSSFDDFVNNYDDSDPHDLATYGLSMRDFV